MHSEALRGVVDFVRCTISQSYPTYHIHTTYMVHHSHTYHSHTENITVTHAIVTPKISQSHKTHITCTPYTSSHTALISYLGTDITRTSQFHSIIGTTIHYPYITFTPHIRHITVTPTIVTPKISQSCRTHITCLPYTSSHYTHLSGCRILVN